METLQQILSDFAGGKLRIEESERQRMLAGDGYACCEAPKSFMAIARSILNGCFTATSGDSIVRVIPTCVEIYYHEEEKDGIKDPIVYHRNTTTHPEVPPFPLGILHNHVSGIDITFESTLHGTTRASALIREFRVENSQNTTVWGFKDVEDRSTYLYAALFSQFNIFEGFTVQWKDSPNPVPVCVSSPRRNVMQYDANGKKLEKVQDPRRWQFRLAE